MVGDTSDLCPLIELINAISHCFYIYFISLCVYSDQSTAYGSACDGSTIYSGSEKRTWGVYALRDNWNYGHSHNHHHHH